MKTNKAARSITLSSVAEAGTFKPAHILSTGVSGTGPVYIPRPASEIGQSMLRAALRRRTPGPGEPAITANDVLRALSDSPAPTTGPRGSSTTVPEAGPDTYPTFAAGVTILPDGRFVVPIVLSSAGLELLTCAAEKMGWKLLAFILDAAVCRAQDIRDECRKKRTPFSDRTDAEDVLNSRRTPCSTFAKRYDSGR